MPLGLNTRLANAIARYFVTSALTVEGAETDGILISGACADGIHISGSNTAAALHISGDQVDAILIDADAAANNAIKVAVDDGKTVGVGLNFDRTGTTGIITTAISIDTDGTTAIDVAAGFTGTTGIQIAGTASGDGILISGACADAIHISGTNTATGLHISGDQVDAILIDVDAAANNGLKIAVDDGITVGTGIALTRTGTTGIATTGISIDTDGTTALSIGTGFTGVTGISIAGTASTAAISISGSAATALSVLTGTFTTGLSLAGTLATGISITGATTTAFAATTATTGGTARNSLSVEVTCTQTHSSGYARGIYTNYTHASGDITGSGEINAIAADLGVTTGDVPYVFAASLYTGSMGTGTIGHLSGLYYYGDDIGGSATVNYRSGLDLNIDNGDNATVASFIRLYNHGGAANTMDYVFDFANAGHGIADYFIHAGAQGGCIDPTGSVGAQVGRVLIIVGATPYAIPYYALS